MDDKSHSINSRDQTAIVEPQCLEQCWMIPGMPDTTLTLLCVSNQHVDGLQIPSPVVLGRSLFQTQLESSAVWNGLSTGGFCSVRRVDRGGT